MPVTRQVETVARRSRRTAVAATAFAAAILCLLALASLAQAAAPRSFFGLSAVRPVPADFKRMADLGAGAHRVEISWGSVQSKRNGEFNWNGPDQRFRRAATFGLRPTPIVFGSPSFATGESKHIRPPVKSRAAREGWKKFVTAAVRRYGPGGTFWLGSPTLDPRLAPPNWIIWNEQNARAFWHPKASPKQYARLLRITRRGIDEVKPRVRMTIGGMYGYPGHADSMNAAKFLKRLYRQRRAKELIDGVSVHPYAGRLKGVKRQTRALRRVMNQAGDRSAALWIGETGWASGGSTKGGFQFMIKNKRGQARLLKQAHRFFLNKREQWNIRRVFWFAFRDYGGDPVCSWCPKAGLLNKRSQMKPSGKAYTRLIGRHVR
jgi:hypothetical protein